MMESELELGMQLELGIESVLNIVSMCDLHKTSSISIALAAQSNTNHVQCRCSTR